MVSCLPVYWPRRDEKRNDVEISRIGRFARKSDKRLANLIDPVFYREHKGTSQTPS